MTVARSPSPPEPGQAFDDLPVEIPTEHAITRRYVLPAGSAAEFMSELEDDDHLLERQMDIETKVDDGYRYDLPDDGNPA